MVRPIGNQCFNCQTTESTVWWKCCPEHCTEQGNDALCDECVKVIHPEFKLEEQPSIIHRNIFEKDSNGTDETPKGSH